MKSQSLQLCECLSGKALRKVNHDVLAESPGEVKRMKKKEQHCLGMETKGGCYVIFSMLQLRWERELKFGCINMAFYIKPVEILVKNCSNMLKDRPLSI